MILEKVQTLNKNYDEWFFVVSNKNFTAKYKQLGKTIDLRGLSKHLNKILLKK